MGKCCKTKYASAEYLATDWGAHHRWQIGSRAGSRAGWQAVRWCCHPKTVERGGGACLQQQGMQLRWCRCRRHHPGPTPHCSPCCPAIMPNQPSTHSMCEPAAGHTSARPHQRQATPAAGHTSARLHQRQAELLGVHNAGRRLRDLLKLAVHKGEHVGLVPHGVAPQRGRHVARRQRRLHTRAHTRTHAWRSPAGAWGTLWQVAGGGGGRVVRTAPCLHRVQARHAASRNAPPGASVPGPTLGTHMAPARQAPHSAPHRTTAHHTAGRPAGERARASPCRRASRAWRTRCAAR